MRIYVIIADSPDKPDLSPTVSERNLFTICAPYMIRIIKKQAKNKQELENMSDEVDDEMLFEVNKLVRLFLRYYRKKFIPLKILSFWIIFMKGKFHACPQKEDFFMRNKT